MKRADFIKAHKVGDWCKVSQAARRGAIPALKFGKMDVPDAVNNRQYCTAIEDQGSKPWCAAYTAAAFAENVLWRKNGKITQIEPDWIYAYAKKHDGDPQGDGTTLDCVLDALLYKGVFDKKTCKVRMVGRGWAGTDEDDVKAAIHRFGCFLGGFNITEEWYDLSRRGIENVTGKKGAKSLGGHAVLVVGYNPAGVWVENSWGSDWGQDGFGFIEWPAFRQQFLYGTCLSNCLDGFK